MRGMRVLEYAAAIISIRNESLILQRVPQFIPFGSVVIRARVYVGLVRTTAYARGAVFDETKNPGNISTFCRITTPLR